MRKISKINNFIKNHKKTAACILAVFSALILYISVPLRHPLFKDDYSLVIKDRDKKLMRAFLNTEEQWIFRPERGALSEKLKEAVLCFEDRFFYFHPGFNPVSVVRAAFRNIRGKKIVSGASTISMQVIRLAYRRERTYINKFIEILQAVKLEICYSKEEILRMYLNHAPYGGNIAGYKAASERYFGKSDFLTWSEACVLAVLPNSPSQISPGKNRDKLFIKKNRLLKKLLKTKKISRPTYESAIAEPADYKEHSFFRAAPHLSRRIKLSSGLSSVPVYTTIDTKIQQLADRETKIYINTLKEQGINNLSLIIADTKTAEIRAYTGSQDFFDRAHNGMVDGIISPRSTGSVLKPFLYAMAIDAGMLTTKSQINDIPTFYGAFSPSNSDRKYSGLVSLSEALTRSLNIPAVRVLNKLGLQTFYMFLKDTGVKSVYRPAQDYGLTLILGGAEITPEELGALYCGLGNLGSFRKLSYINHEKQRARQLLSKESSYLILDILKNLKRPGTEFYWNLYKNNPPLAWKTGTSYGQKDSWAAGVSPQWTIVVWAGNFTGEGNTNLTGLNSAAPLLFSVFNTLPRNSEIWFSKKGLKFRETEICVSSGFRATDACRERETVSVPEKAPPVRTCPYHKFLFISDTDNKEVCSKCWEPGHYQKKAFTVFPPEVAAFLRYRGVETDTVPEHRSTCSSAATVSPVSIVYPVNNSLIWIPRDYNGEYQKVTFTAAPSSKNARLFWYIDQKYIGTTVKIHKVALMPDKGRHVLKVIDHNGNSSSKRFTVFYRK